MIKTFVYIALIILPFFSLKAHDFDSSDDLPQLLLSISDDLYYNYNEAIDKIDSISSLLSDEDQLEFKPYFQYFNSYRAYKTSIYDGSIALADSALTYFLWEENLEWQSRCVLAMAFTAEALLLDNYALSYYETASELTECKMVKGLALLGLARSKNKLKKDYQDIANKAIAMLNSTDLVESHLFAKRNYYYFNPSKKDQVSKLKDIEREYLSRGYDIFAAITNKQISYYFKDIDNIEQAEVYALKAIRLIENTKDSISVFTSSLYLYYSSILLLKNDVKLAQKYIEDVIVINQALNLDHTNYYAYQRLSKINRYNEDYKAADQNSQKAIVCQEKLNKVKRSSSALLAEVLINRDYIDKELNKTKVYQYIRLGLFVVLSLVFFRALITRYRRQVEAKDKEVSKLQEDNTVLQKNALEMLSIVKKLEQESSLLSASEDFEKRIVNDSELSSSLPKDFCHAYQKNISIFSFQHNKLSHAEVRTAVMLAMDIPSKSIVKLQCIEPDTLKTYRKRIRRKLKLEKGIDLNHFLKTVLYDLGRED